VKIRKLRTKKFYNIDPRVDQQRRALHRKQQGKEKVAKVTLFSSCFYNFFANAIKLENSKFILHHFHMLARFKSS
jgi:hypothetical protein